LFGSSATRGFAAGAVAVAALALFGRAAGFGLFLGAAAAGARIASKQTREATLRFIEEFSFANENRDGW